MPNGWQLSMSMHFSFLYIQRKAERKWRVYVAAKCKLFFTHDRISKKVFFFCPKEAYKVLVLNDGFINMVLLYKFWKQETERRREALTYQKYFLVLPVFLACNWNMKW